VNAEQTRSVAGSAFHVRLIIDVAKVGAAAASRASRRAFCRLISFA
jgi:hypothetical protein